MRKEIINTWNGEKVELKISSDGYCFCPVCGRKSNDKKWRPYDENGHPSYDICSCGFEYGFDDNGEKVELKISSDGYCFCPVCGRKSNDKKWRPYDENGHPSYDICSCGFEYGFDDNGEPPYYKSWENYRKKWLNGKIEQFFGKRITKNEKLEQLKNLEL